MRIDDVIWLPRVVDKLVGKHGVWPEEVEEVFLNRPHVRFHERGHVRGEDLYTALGQSDSGRYLIVFFVLKAGNRALVISARDMDRAERKRYGKK